MAPFLCQVHRDLEVLRLVKRNTTADHRPSCPNLAVSNSAQRLEKWQSTAESQVHCLVASLQPTRSWMLPSTRTSQSRVGEAVDWDRISSFSRKHGWLSWHRPPSCGPETAAEQDTGKPTSLKCDSGGQGVADGVMLAHAMGQDECEAKVECEQQCTGPSGQRGTCRS